MTIYYKHSKLASLLSIVGCLVGIGGIVAFIDLKEFVYFFVIAGGFALLYIGSRIGGKKDFEAWLAAQDTKENEKKIKKSLSFAMEKYQECPNKYTYEYINKLNPEAGTYIQKDRSETQKNLMTLWKKDK